MRIRRYSVAFEVYNPYSVLQLSEVLQDFRIRVGDRVVYQGEAVVAGLVNTGTLLVCEATLGNAWQEVGFPAGRLGGSSLEDQFDTFVQDWRRAHEVDPDFKLTVADMQNMLLGIQRWLEQIDLGIRAPSSAPRPGLEREILAQIEGRLEEEIHALFSSIDKASRQVPEGRDGTHKFYARRQLHPLLLASPFAHRTYHKPLGYAGDYEMVGMMMRDPYEGGSLFAKVLNHAFLNTAPVIAHRNRIEYLAGMIGQEAEDRALAGRRTRILSLGCGPAQEVQNFLRTEELSDLCDFTLIDFNEETIDYTRRRLNRIRSQAGRITPVNLMKRSVHQLLRQASGGDIDLDWESFDVIYCAGLFDYLSQRVCKRLVELLYKLLRPGGQLVVTNVSTSNPFRAAMEFALEWNLIHRDEKDMKELVPATVAPANFSLKADPTGVNFFLEIRKRPIHGSRG